MTAPTIGLLALQGNFDSHRERLEQLGAVTKLLRKPTDFEDISGLIIPGGESTALLRLLTSDLRDTISSVAARIPLLVTCAGAILLAREVNNPAQDSLSLLDIEVSRNGFGRQADSFISPVQWSREGREFCTRHLAATKTDAAEQESLEGIFIRAPRITRIGAEVEVLAHFKGEPVLVRQDRIIASTFHPELSTDDTTVHRLFLALSHGTEAASY